MIYLLFGLSGFAGLLYEVVWTRRLVLLFGGTVYSVSAVLAAFMGGLAFGALAGSRLARRTRDPWRLYGLLELAVAAGAAAFPLALRAIFWLLERAPTPSPFARFALAAGALLPATTLMGATFPVLARCVDRRGRGVGRLYAANLAGACAGTLGGAFLLLPTIGLGGAQRAALAINLAVGLCALFAPGPAAEPGEAAVRVPPRAGVDAAGVAVLVSGFCGMAFEVVWTRLMVPFFNNSAYGFAGILFVFLLGLGAGSVAESRWRTAGPRRLGLLLVLSGAAAVLGYCAFERLALWEIGVADMRNYWSIPVIGAPLVDALATVLPLAVFQGMVLPAAVRVDGNADGTVGRLYFWNTCGGILGSLVAGFWWIPAYHAQNALMWTVACTVLSGAGLLVALESARARRVWVPAAGAAAVAAAWGWIGQWPLPAELLARWNGRDLRDRSTLLRVTDDAEASVAVMSAGSGRYLTVNGIRVTAYSNSIKLLAHVPLALHPDPRRALVICFGMGTTFRSAMSHGVRVDAVELVPSVLAAFPFFHPDAGRVGADPRARLLVNDGRNQLLCDREGYDVIIVDPSPPLYAAGTVNLYTREFFQLARSRLKPNGLLAVWLPMCPEEDFKMILRSFLESMPRTQVWSGAYRRDGLMLVGSNEAIDVDRRRAESRLHEPAVRADLLQFDRQFERDEAFWSLFRGAGERYKEYARDAPDLTDDFPRIEYPFFRSRRPGYLRLPEALDWPAPNSLISRPAPSGRERARPCPNAH